MNDVLSEIYYGNYSVPTRSYRPDSTYKKVLRKAACLEQELLDAIPEELRKKFMSYQNTSAFLSSLTCEMEFREGFRLGAQLMLAALDTDSGENT